MEQLLTLCASIIEATTTPSSHSLTKSIFVQSYDGTNKVVIDSNDAVLTVCFKPQFNNKYTETVIKLRQYTDRPPVEVIEELTSIALKEWSECNSEYLIDNKIKQLLKK